MIAMAMGEKDQADITGRNTSLLHGPKDHLFIPRKAGIDENYPLLPDDKGTHHSHPDRNHLDLCHLHPQVHRYPEGLKKSGWGSRPRQMEHSGIRTGFQMEA